MASQSNLNPIRIPQRTRRTSGSWIAFSLLALSGCSRAEPEAKPARAPYEASHATASDQVATPSNEALQRLADASAGLNSSTAPAQPVGPSKDESQPATDREPTGPPDAEATTALRQETMLRQDSERRQETSSRPAAPDPAVGRAQLPADLPPNKLIEFLGMADRELQDIWSRLPQIPGGREELIRIVKLKLEASRRLKDHDQADEKAKSIGARGELQALSHLASFSDVNSAQALEELAERNLLSGDANLVADSRLVLIGFALEALQHGEPGAADRVIGYVDQIAASESARDVPTLMILGQARDALADYGHEEHGRRVRKVIIDLFADSPNPDLAQAAAEFANNVLFDQVDGLLANALNGQAISVDQWRAAVNQLLADVPDLRAVQFLAGSALQLEAAEKLDLVESTFDALNSRFDDADTVMSQEVRAAAAAMHARQDVIGLPFNPVLPSVEGSDLSMDPYKGRVILVPFWAAAFPESLQVIESLSEIQQSHPADVAIIGVNLDGDDELLEAFQEANQLGFPSFRSKSAAEAEVANPLAAQFGIVSMPFLAILDRQGRVAAVNLDGQGIEETVNELIQQ